MLVAWDLYSTQIICTEAHFIKGSCRSLCEFSFGSEELLLQYSDTRSWKDQNKRNKKD